MKFRWLRQQLWVPPFRGYDSTWSEFWADIPWKQWYFWKQTNCQCLSVFFWWWTPILWESDCLIEIFLCFSYTRKWRAICISSNSHTHSSSKNTTWCIKTFKTYCRDLLLPHFGLPGFFPPSLLGQVSGRYRGFTASWLWVAYYWKSEGGGKVGVGWDVGPKNAGWNHGEIRESMVKGDSGEEEQWLAAIWLSADEITHCNINKGMLPLENRNKTTTERHCDFFFCEAQCCHLMHPFQQPTPLFWVETFFSSSKRCPNGSTPSLSADRFDQLGASMAVGDANWAWVLGQGSRVLNQISWWHICRCWIFQPEAMQEFLGGKRQPTLKDVWRS